jgi:large subunit ribosomal protein L25
METGELLCEIRPIRPKGARHQVRREGRVPGVLYGPKTTPTAVSVNAIDLRNRVAHAATQRIMRLKSTASELDGKHVLVKDIQRAPVSREILHADLYEVDLNRPIRVSVPLHFVGKAAGVAEGGILAPLIREVEVECLPLEIPEFFDVDVSALGIHDVIHVSAMKFAGNVKPIFDTDYPVVSILPPTVEAAPTPVAAAEVAGAEGAAPAEGAAAAPAAEGGKEGATAAGAKPAAGAKKEEKKK